MTVQEQMKRKIILEWELSLLKLFYTKGIITEEEYLGISAIAIEQGV